MKCIYALKLERGKYYIGSTEDIEERITQHFEGRGSEFTKLFRPLKVIETKTGVDDYDEDKLVKLYMSKHGTENVRGGSYSSIHLPEYQILALETELKGASNRCFRCGSDEHFVSDCYTRKRIMAKQVHEIDKNGEESEDDQEEDSEDDDQEEDSEDDHFVSCSYTGKRTMVQQVYEIHEDDEDGDESETYEEEDQQRRFDAITSSTAAVAVRCFRCGGYGHYANRCNRNNNSNNLVNIIRMRMRATMTIASSKFLLKLDIYVPTCTT